MATLRPGRTLTQAVRALRSGELVGVSLGYTADTLVRGAEIGRFPIPRSTGARLTPWFAPRARAVLRPDEVHLGQTLRRRLRRSGWTTSVDAAFDEVLDRCADRESTWLTARFRESVVELHRRGIAHSLEVWDEGGDLVGGLYGMQIGGLMSVDSMFHSTDDSSKAALADLARRVRVAGGVAIDCQYLTPHTEALGARTIDRVAFERLVGAARALVVVLPTDRRPAARLVDPQSPDALDTSAG